MSNKLLYEIEGRCLFEYGIAEANKVLRTYNKVYITLITRYDFIYKWAIDHGIEAVYSPESINGASFTIKNALMSLKNLKEDDYILFVAADQPFIKAKTLVKLIECSQKGILIARVKYKEKVGNPVIFSAKLKDELCNLKGDMGGRVLIEKYGCEYVEAEDETELIDIDYTEDVIKNNGKFNF
ncbi:MAG: NTP transferase domain-containing protein [Eubacterium sp.]|nr:NTP transferase domain-containing protein [Eubacterium sp.]